MILRQCVRPTFECHFIRNTKTFTNSYRMCIAVSIIFEMTMMRSHIVHMRHFCDTAHQNLTHVGREREREKAKRQKHLLKNRFLFCCCSFSLQNSDPLYGIYYCGYIKDILRDSV